MGGKRRKTTSAEGRSAYYAMVLPALVIYLFVMAFPTILSVVFSLSNYNGGQIFGEGSTQWGIIGFDYYLTLFRDPAFWNALKNNVYIILVSVFGQIPLGFLFAYLIYRKLVKFPAFWQGVLYMPAIISSIVVGILWQTIFSPYGPLADLMNVQYHNQFMSQISELVRSSGGIQTSDEFIKKLIEIAGPTASQFSNPLDDIRAMLQTYDPLQIDIFKADMSNLFAQKWSTDFMNQNDVSMLPILFVILWMYTGMYLIIFLANMQRIDVQIIEAAQIDGATENQILRHIILPSLSGVIVTAAILAISGSLRSFDVIFAMTGGGPAKVTQVLSIYMFDNAFKGAPNYPLANAISTVMVVLSFILIWVTQLIEKRFGGKE